MARTAPAPNFPAIPGMNPGIFILGGGGDGGGSGAGRGKGGSGKQGAGGNNGGKDANGGGKGAGNCGPGSGSGCPQHNASLSAGDPVEVATGTVFTPTVTDVWLRGPLQLVFARSYRSDNAERDIGLGHGWSHSLGWRVQVRRRAVRVWMGDGTFIDFDMPPDGGEVIGRGGWLLRRTGDVFAVQTLDELWRIFEIRSGDDRLLSEVRDRHGRRIALTYEDGLLVEAVDPAGRAIRFRHGPDRRIRMVMVRNALEQGQWVDFARYHHDDDGNLVSAVDADGHLLRYAYEAHLLTACVHATGMTVHYTYDPSSRCIETWSDHPGQADISLSPTAPAMLADGSTRAKGVLHCRFDYAPDGYTEVTGSTQVLRVFSDPFGGTIKAISGGNVVTRSFDALGFETSVMDPLGGETRYERDARGRILREIDPLGFEEVSERDAAGRVVRFTDKAGYTSTILRDAQGDIVQFTDQLGGTYVYTYKDGLLVTATNAAGATTRYEHNALGDLVRLVQPDGSAWSFVYDGHGRCVSVIDPEGGADLSMYTGGGDLVMFRDPEGATWHYRHDGAHKLVGIGYPDGREAEIVRAGFHVPVIMRKPDGTAFEIRYDREGRPAEVRNAAGEVHRFTRDPEGYLIEERTFDGRELRYRYDAGRRIVQHEEGGETTLLDHDALGQLIRCEYPDGTIHTYEYDPRGLLSAAAWDGGEVRFDRDAMGRTVKETQTCLGETHVVEVTYAPNGLRLSRETSLDHTMTFTRDAMGNARRIGFDEASHIELEFDMRGLETERLLPERGRMCSRHDRNGRTVEQLVLAAGPVAAPVSVAGLVDPRGAPTVATRHQFSTRGDLAAVWDAERGTTQYEYDAIGQVLRATSNEHAAEALFYDGAGNVHNGLTRGARRYGAGNILEQDGSRVYRHDDRGRLVEKIVTDAAGQQHTWRYSYGGTGLLGAVETPEGARVELTYDPLGRRLAKRFIPPANAPDRIPSLTRFVWDAQALVHEIHKLATTAGDAVVSERTYWIDGEEAIPHAQRDGKAGSPWFFYVNKASGAPDRLVDGSGQVRCSWRSSVFGRTEELQDSGTSTPLRFPGQYDDQEIELYYNRYRYYDPDLGRYISPDPLGLDAGLNVFRYVENIPTTWTDPTGLKGGAVGYIVLNDGTTIPRSGMLSESGMPNTPHASNVQAALPRRNSFPGAPKYPPGVCVEAHLMSELARAGKTPADIAPGGLVVLEGRHPHNVKPPCGYCQRMLSSLGVQPSQIMV